MWKCPKCGREFKRTNQGHYCGNPPKTVAEYIESQPSEFQPHLKEMAQTIRNSVPDVKERILWSMPFFEKADRSISFSACKKHISFYIGFEVIEKFKSELGDFTINKDAVYFPYNKQLPLDLISEITKCCLS